MIKLIYPKFWQTKNIIAYLLLPVSWIYLFATYIRKLIARPIKFPGKVVCVGNVSVGGTGKTQIVIFVAQILKAQNIDFIIITKGYRSNLTKAVLVNEFHAASEVGDEAVMLRAYGRVIAAKKIGDIQPFLRQLKPSIIIVDDSLQNPNFHKDVIILTIDGDRLFGNRFLLPAGPLRQNPQQILEKSDIIISVSSTFTYYERLPLNIRLLAEVELCKKSIKDKLFQAQIVPSIELDRTLNYFAFSGIGNPLRFFSTLENYGLKLIGCKSFPDHHQYSQKDLQYLEEQADKYHAQLITTRKDYVKIYSIKLPIICCDVHLSINNNSQLINLIYEKIL